VNQRVLNATADEYAYIFRDPTLLQLREQIPHTSAILVNREKGQLVFHEASLDTIAKDLPHLETTVALICDQRRHQRPEARAVIILIDKIVSLFI
jgi:hypothetical protein